MSGSIIVVKFFGSIIVVRETVVCNQAGSVAGPTRATAYPGQVYMSSCNRAGAGGEGEGEWETRARPGPAQGSRSHIQCESKLVSYMPKLRFGGKTDSEEVESARIHFIWESVRSSNSRCVFSDASRAHKSVVFEDFFS